MPMHYKLFGRTGLRVSELCLGTMTFGDAYEWSAPKAECARIVDAFAQAGGNFIDTANYYSHGQSERIVGELIAGDRERWVLATKYSLAMRPDDPNSGGTHRKSLRQSLEASLRRLGTDYVDVYWVHIWDDLTPLEEVVQALDDAVRAGKVLYVGISDTPAWVVARAANTIAELRAWTPFAALQVPYSLLQRDIEHELLPMAEAFAMTIAAWSPLAGGILTGKFSRPDGPEPGTRVEPTSLTNHDHAVARAVQ